jgi:general stress protein 26
VTDESAPKALDELMRGGTTLMVGAETAGRWDFRPLTVARVEGECIDILVDLHEDWLRRFDEGDALTVTLSDDKANNWASLHGTGTLSDDRALIDELWNPFAAAYFDEGKDSPGIAVLRITVSDGRYWATPSGRVGALISMVKAQISGADASGQHGDVRV